MQWLVPLAGLLGIEVEILVRQLKQSALLYGLLGLCALLALAFALVALDLWLATLIGPIWAALAIAGLFLVLALIVWLVAVVGNARREKARALRRRSADSTALVTTAALTALPVLLGNPTIRRFGLPLGALAAALLLLRGEDKERTGD